MIFAPGSFPWLLAHDVRLNWRRFAGMFGEAPGRVVAAVLLAGAVLVHVAAWPAALWLSPLVHGGIEGAPAIATFLICVFTWMIAQSLFGTARTLYDRGDLDLLLGSPLSVGRVFAAKASAVCAGTFGAIGLLTLPLANAGAIADRASWLAIYPVLLALALIATAIALAISIALFFLIGPRRARTFTQMIGAGIGGIFVLGAQIVAMLPARMRGALSDWAQASGAWSAADLGGSTPLLALRGDGQAIAVLLLIGGGLFGSAVAGLGRRFAAASLVAAGAAVTSGIQHDRSAPIVFRAGIGHNLRRKEWRLLGRDPNLFAQIGLQIVYTIPIAVVLLRNEALPAAMALAPTLVVVAAQVAASLAWITVSGEDAPELIASAPVAQGVVERAKLSAVALPVLAVLALPLLGLALVSWQTALLAALFAAGAATSTALLNFWHPMPGNRRGMLRRHSQSKLIALVEHGLAVSWALAIVLALLGSFLAVAPVVLAGVVLAVARRGHGATVAAPPPAAMAASPAT